MLKSLFPILFLALAAPAMAQDDTDWRFGGDAYSAGRSVTVSGDTVDDVFAAGDRVTVRADVNGSAHMAGRYVTLDGRVGQNFYGAGMEVEVAGPVAGNVSAIGESVVINEPVSGNLRAAGSNVEVNAPIAGNAVLGGEYVEIDAAIVGDVALGADEVVWGDGAKIDGTLHVYSDDPDAVEVPDRVVSSDRIERHEAREFDDVSGIPGMERPSLLQRLRGWIGSVIVVGLLGTALAALAPDYVAGLREKALDRPLRVGWIGFVSLSALVGSVVFLAMTGIGIILVPVSLIATVLLGIAGYVVGAYFLGVWATGVAGRPLPASTGERAIAAFAGAALIAAIALVPFLGWLAVMAVFFVGAGALAAKMFGRAMRSDTV